MTKTNQTKSTTSHTTVDPFWLTVDLTRASAATLAMAVQDGLISPADYVAVMDLCGGCGAARTCTGWQSPAAPPPVACPNGALIMELMA